MNGLLPLPNRHILEIPAAFAEFPEGPPALPKKKTMAIFEKKNIGTIQLFSTHGPWP